MVIVDSDVLISAFRGNQMAIQLIRKYMPAVYISVVTEIELYIGATNKSKRDSVAQVLSVHEIIPINRSISEIAIRLVKTYNTGSRCLHLPDAFIAATCMDQNCRLLTFNSKDFKFIKGLQLAK